jgi:hypothetical protein
VFEKTLVALLTRIMFGGFARECRRKPVAAGGKVFLLQN